MEGEKTNVIGEDQTALFGIIFDNRLTLRWLETVSSSFQDLEFDGSL